MIPIDKVLEFCKEKGYAYHIHGKKPVAVLFGEVHETENLPPQEELISIIKPKLILHEGADPEYAYNSRIEQILGWKEKFGIDLELCDIPEHNLNIPNFSKDSFKHYIYDLLEESGLSSHPNWLEPIMKPMRELVMGTIIYERIKKENVPLYVSVGAHHIRPSSEIHGVLENKNNQITSYITILQYPKLIDMLNTDAHFYKFVK